MPNKGHAGLTSSMRRSSYRPRVRTCKLRQALHAWLPLSHARVSDGSAAAKATDNRHNGRSELTCSSTDAAVSVDSSTTAALMPVFGVGEADQQ